MLIGELEVALDVGQKLDSLGVTWLVGGSVASSILGEPRATADVDLVADLRGRHVSALFAALVDTYYIDEDAAKAAVRERGAFNVIQLASMTKVDIYCSADEPLAREELQRRIFVDIDARRSRAHRPRTSSCRSCCGSSRAAVSRTGSGATSAGSSRSRARRSIARTSSVTPRATACSICCTAR